MTTIKSEFDLASGGFSTTAHMQVSAKTLSRALGLAKRELAQHDIHADIVAAEGAEKSGYGAIKITGSLTTDERNVSIVYNESAWRNVGAPSGTVYTIDLTLSWRSNHIVQNSARAS